MAGACLSWQCCASAAAGAATAGTEAAAPQHRPAALHPLDTEHVYASATRHNWHAHVP
jgi:hypothetical protein